MSWYNEVAADAQAEIESFDFASIVGEQIDPEITSRAKTIDTLRDKLIRDHGMALPSIQDVAGVRIDASITLRQQDALALAVAEHFKEPTTAIHDLRATPHSGYRAVHVWLRRDARVEVQIRTTLQSEWANIYEALGDKIGRGIRYDEMPTDPAAGTVVSMLRTMSLDQIAPLEQGMDVVASQATLPTRLKALGKDASLLPGLRDAINAGLNPRETVRALEAELQAALQAIRYAIAGLPGA